MRVLVDTSVWVDFFSKGEATLRELLMDGGVLIHPFVIGEIACGSLKNRRETLQLLQSLPRIESCTDEEVLHFLDKHQLFAKGVGWVDLHLLASARVAGKQLWTKDQRLSALANTFRH